LLGRQTVSIVDAESDITAPGRRVQDQELIETDTQMPVCHPPDNVALRFEVLLAAIDDDEIVAQTMHLDEPHPGSRERFRGRHRPISVARFFGLGMSGHCSIESF
jgi:hypothetical protein